MKNVPTPKNTQPTSLQPSMTLQATAQNILQPPLSALNTAFDSQNIKDLFGHYKIYNQDYKRPTSAKPQKPKKTIQRQESHVAQTNKENVVNQNAINDDVDKEEVRSKKLLSQKSLDQGRFESEKTQKNVSLKVAGNNYLNDTVDQFYGEYRQQFMARADGLGRNVELKRRVEDLENVILHWQLTNSNR